MKRNSRILKIVFVSLVLNVFFPLFAEDTSPAPYKKDEFPLFLQDLRRFEIISLGALPFVTLDTSLAYSTYRYIQNDFNSEYLPSLAASSSFDSDEQIGIILTSVGISLGIVLTDYIIRLIKRSGGKKKRMIKEDESVRIIPISQDKDAVQLELPEVNDSEVIEVEE